MARKTLLPLLSISEGSPRHRAAGSCRLLLELPFGPRGNLRFLGEHDHLAVSTRLVERFRYPHFDPTVLLRLAGALQDALDRMGAAQDDAKAFVAADVDFHLLLADAAANTFLREILSSVQELLRVWIRRVIDAADSTEPSYMEHVAILDAVRSGNADLAGLAMRQHMDRANARLLETLDPKDTDADGHSGDHGREEGES